MTTNYQRDLDKIVQATLASLDYMKPEAELKSAYTALFNYIAKSAAEEYGILEQRVETQFHSKFSTWMVDQAAYRRYFSKIYNPLMSEAQEIFEWASNRIENMKKALGNFIFERNEFRGLWEIIINGWLTFGIRMKIVNLFGGIAIISIFLLLGVVGCMYPFTIYHILVYRRTMIRYIESNRWASWQYLRELAEFLKHVRMGHIYNGKTFDWLRDCNSIASTCLSIWIMNTIDYCLWRDHMTSTEHRENYLTVRSTSNNYYDFFSHQSCDSTKSPDIDYK